MKQVHTEKEEKNGEEKRVTRKAKQKGNRRNRSRSEATHEFFQGERTKERERGREVPEE